MTFNGETLPSDARFSTKTPTNLSDFDRIVFALDGFGSARENKTIQNLGIDPESIEMLAPGVSKSVVTAGLVLRLHPIPIALKREDYVFVDLSYLVQKYRSDCIPPLLQDYAARVYDKALRKNCEI